MVNKKRLLLAQETCVEPKRCIKKRMLKKKSIVVKKIFNSHIEGNPAPVHHSLRDFLLLALFRNKTPLKKAGFSPNVIKKSAVILEYIVILFNEG